jgi:3-dehydroquinate synthetase
VSSNKVDLSKIDLDKEKEKAVDLPGLIEFAHTVGGAVIKTEDKGRIKGNAVAGMRDQTDRQYRQLHEQMQTLIEQAKYLKKRVEVSERIYQSDMGFSPVIDKIYYLYQRKNGKDILSMVAPKEWGKSMPFENFIAEVRLLSDHTWELINVEDESYYH